MAEYRLLCGDTTGETAMEAQYHRFSVVNAEHVLIYSDKPVDCAEMKPATDDTMVCMSDTEKTWLRNCITETCIERGDAEQADANDRAFMEAFERELETERQILDGKAVSADGGTERAADE